MKKISVVTALICALLLTGCEIESLYSAYRANFSFDGSIHPYNQARSFGQYICIRRVSNNIGQYRLTDALGNEQTVNIPQIQIQQNPFFYGLAGFIIGTPTAYGDGKLIAYDWGCPKCERQNIRIDIDYVMGHALCPECHTKFDLNSGGIPIEGESRPLLQYRVFDNGSQVIIQN